jgi:polyadenylate-binding protein
MAVPTSYASASLYVGDLNQDVTEALLFEIFNAVGPVASVRVCRDAATRRSLGYAYCNFHRVEDAERALDTMNFKNIRNRPCRIMWSHRDPSLRRSGLGNIFVKNLAPTIDNKSLYDTFSMFGNILSCKVCVNAKRESLGYGFVHYESEESATSAIAKVDGKVIAGQKVSVQPFKAKKERSPGVAGNFTNVFVKNIPDDVSQEQLQALFAKCGTITSIMIAADTDGKTKGFGFINYESVEQANAAVETYNNYEMGEKKIFVARAQKREEREKELRERFEQLKVERQKKYEGVNLYVKNLSDDTDDAKLRETFKQFGDITSAKIMADPAGKGKGFGFVCFATPEEATKAVTEMNGRMLDGKPLYVALAQRKEVRRGQLEAQYNARAKMGAPPPQMFPPQGAPMYYAAPGMGGPPRNFIYPQQAAMMPRRWNPQQQGQPGAPQQMMGMPGMPRHGPGVSFSLMPVPGANQRNPAGGPQGGMNPNQQPRQPRNVRRQGGPQGQGQQKMPMQQPMDAESAVIPQAEESADAPLTIKQLAAAPEEQKKQMIGERLFPLIKQRQPNLAGKITGMLLEMDNGELIHLLESREALNEKISEALHVLDSHTVDEQ